MKPHDHSADPDATLEPGAEMHASASQSTDQPDFSTDDQAQQDQLSVTMDSAQSATMTPATGLQQVNDPKSRFRVLRSHARGGLGEVFVAIDDELERKVALKQIRHEYADLETSRWRFVLEARVTGRLEHPGIVPVYSLETHEGQAPQYAMRFIEGESLDGCVKRLHSEDKLVSETDFLSQLRPLLTRFVNVCQAIGYAHSRGVIHRDIKPANIMVGEYGETLVVDWGLAKVTDVPDHPPADYQPADSQPTQRHSDGDGSTIIEKRIGDVEHSPTSDGDVVGTLAYMSPEQTSGKPDGVTVQSDVYSLGVTLYQMLCGSKPYSGSSIEVFKALNEGNFEPPREINRRVPKALNAICLKAMSLKPVDRYETAIALADDIEHFLGDEPTVAMPDSPAAKAFRFARRHRAWTISGAIALLLTSVTATAAALVVNHYRNENALIASQERIAKEQAIVAKTEEQQAKEAATRQALLALETLDTLLIRIQETLEETPASSSTRIRLLEIALVNLENVSREFVSDDNLKRKRMLAFQRLSRIALETGRVSSNGETPLEFARRAATDALRMARENLVPRPKNIMARRDVVISLDDLANVEQMARNADAEKRLLLESLEITNETAAMYPDDPRGPKDLIYCFGSLGALELSLGNPEAAKIYFEKQVKLAEELSSGKAISEMIWALKARSLGRLGSAHSRLKQHDEATRLIGESLEILEERHQADPNDFRKLSELSVGIGRLAKMYLDQSQSDLALQQFRRAIRILKDFVEREPGHLNYSMQLAEYHRRAALIHFANETFELQKEHLLQSKALYQTLLQQDDQNPEVVYQATRVFYDLGDSYFALEDEANARQAWQRGLDISQPLINEGKGGPRLMEHANLIRDQMKRLQQ